jgi:hypothetical protein
MISHRNNFHYSRAVSEKKSGDFKEAPYNNGDLEIRRPEDLKRNASSLSLATEIIDLVQKC